jgi:glucose-1-phosphate thymidylyltransferase
MVQVDGDGRVSDLVIQPAHTPLRYSWDAALWTPVFTEFLHDYLKEHGASAATSPELSVGAVIRLALRSGMRVEGVPVSDQPYVDIGTPEGLRRAMDRFASTHSASQ